uniref:Proline-rich transmembrane protein 3/4 domain-containing protein n=1 Tax=Anopheles atroparvus TaxID=41427 RepID=A0A182ILA7_ANOAO
MSCRDGTRSLRARYKPSLASVVKLRGSPLAMGTADECPGESGVSTDGLWSVQPCTIPHRNRPATNASSDSSRVCGMALAELTTRHSDSSSGSRSDYNGSCDNVYSISTTKSDPRFSSISGNSSSISPTTMTGSDRRKGWSDDVDATDGNTVHEQVRVTSATGWRRPPAHHSSSSQVRYASQTLARLLIIFVSSILLCHPWHSPGAPATSGFPLLLDGVGAVLLDTNGGDGKAPVQAFGDGLGGINLEQSIAAVFSRVAYGSTTTTKRSIPDNVYVPSLTTVSTPLLTTFRYREKDKEPIGGPGAGGAGGPGGDKDSHYNHQQISANHRNYELDLERDHVLPTSAPNAEILKSNSNPTYPNPNRHHNHDRHRHSNSTPYPHGHNAKKGFPTNSMFSGDIPAYSPPSRTLFTPPLPRNYTNPFADKPTLRGTNSDSTIINTGIYANRRPLPPPSLMPGHERIPMRPPDLMPGAPGSGILPVNGPAGSLNPQKGSGGSLDPAYAPGGPPGSGSSASQSMEAQRKKALNTPSEKSNKLDAAKNYDGNNKLFLLDENANSSAILPNGMHFPSISRILSGSNGRPQMIPDVLLRSVTSAPRPNQPSFELGGNGPTSLSNSKNPAGTGGSPFGGGKPVGPDGGGDRERDGANDGVGGAGGGGGGEGSDGPNSDGEGRRPYDEDEEDEEDDPFDEGAHSRSTSNAVTSTVSSMHVLSSSSSPITQKMPNLNLKSVMVKNGSGDDGGAGGTGGSYGNDRNFQGEIADISTWTIAWNIHVYLSAILYTILAVYSIFKIIFYDKLTHLFSQSYFISIHLILIIICLLRIFYLCYDAYNIHFSFNLFTSEVLLNLPLTFLTTTFAILILFLLLRSINHKTNRYSSILRPLTIMIGSGVHVGLCITLHLVESYETQQFYHKQHQLQLQNKQLMMTAGGGGGRVPGHAPSPTNIQIPPRVLSLICQIIYIFICLSLGLLYLYMYRLLKRILHKSQNYIHGYNNLSYAIHITIATALLFILLAALQIYGAISISSQTKVKLSPSHTLHDGSAKKTLWASHIEIDWFQWGYQFSLRFIEIVIIALLSWVTGLKTGPSKVIQREKDMEQPNASGFALFPCTSSSSQENFETDYPAVCNTNRNLHTYTMRTGKPIYDDNFALNSLNLEQNSQQDLQLGGGPPGVVGPVGMVGGVAGNDFQRSLETNSMRSSSHNYSNNYNGSNNDHMPEPGDDFLNDTETMPDHYENPNFELKHHNHQHHHQQQQQQQLSGSGSANQYHDIMDNCYSEPINAPQYDTKSLRGQPGHPIAQHRNYDFQNFERPNFDPSGHPSQPPPPQQQPHGQPGGIPQPAASISRGEFRASKNLKTLKSGQMQNDLGGGANTMGHHHYNHHNNMGPSAPPVGNYGDSFDRRIGVRKSGTLNNIGAMHFNQHVGGGSGRNNNSNSSASSSASSNNRAALQQQQQQQQQQQRGRGPMSGAQTLSSSRSDHHHHHHHHHPPPPPQPPTGHNFVIPGSFNDRLLNGAGGGADSLERNHPHLQQQQQQQQHALSSQDNVSNNFDEGLPNGPSAYYHSKKRSRESSSSSYTGGGPGGAVPYPVNNGGGNDHQTESSSSPTASIGGSIGHQHPPSGGGSGSGTPTTGVLPGKLGGGQQQDNGSMLVAEQGFVRFRALEEPTLGSRTNLRPDAKGKLFINS